MEKIWHFLNYNYEVICKRIDGKMIIKERWLLHKENCYEIY